MGAMHGIAGLKGDDAAPAQPGKLGAQFRRSQANGSEVIMGSGMNSLHASSHVP